MIRKKRHYKERNFFITLTILLFSLMLLASIAEAQYLFAASNYYYTGPSNTTYTQAPPYIYGTGYTPGSGIGYSTGILGGIGYGQNPVSGYGAGFPWGIGYGPGPTIGYGAGNPWGIGYGPGPLIGYPAKTFHKPKYPVPVRIAIDFGKLEEVTDVSNRKVTINNSEYVGVLGIADDGVQTYVGVDPKNNEVVRFHKLCPRAINDSPQAYLIEAEAIKKCLDFLEEKDLSPLPDDYSLEKAKLVEFDNFYRWEVTWAHESDGVKVGPDYIKFTINADPTGHVISYAKVSHPVEVSVEPYIQKDQAIDTAREMLGVDKLENYDSNMDVLDTKLMVVYPNNYFDSLEWKASQTQALCWIITFGYAETPQGNDIQRDPNIVKIGPAIDIWIDAMDGTLQGGEIYERPIPELFGIHNQQGDITNIWEPALDNMQYNTIHTILNSTSEATIVNRISNGFIFVFHSHGHASTADLVWNASTDEEILSPEEVPNNDLRYALVSCCESGFDRPFLADFKDVFVSRGSDVFQGYKESMDPDPYETQLVYYLQKGWTLYSAHEQAKDDVNPWFTVVFKYNLPCINKVRLAPLLVDVDAPDTACSSSSFTITAKVTNREDARNTTATGVKAQLVYPSGFSILSGANPQTIGSINWNQTKSATWNVKSNGIFMSGTYTFDVIVWSDNLGVEVDDPGNPYHKFSINLMPCFWPLWEDWLFYQYPTYWPLPDPPPGPLRHWDDQWRIWQPLWRIQLDNRIQQTLLLNPVWQLQMDQTIWMVPQQNLFNGYHI